MTTNPENNTNRMEVRLAIDESELRAAQKLRYQVFFEELNAKPSIEVAEQRRDFDKYDEFCDHLLLLDKTLGKGAEAIVGTYRLIIKNNAKKLGGFYSSGEFDIKLLENYSEDILELGRSCIAPNYRDRNCMNLMWRGVSNFVVERNITIMFGCASLPGTDTLKLQLPLNYLYYHHLAPSQFRVSPLTERRVEMKTLTPDAINLKQAIRQLPPLLKGYLRLGGFVGDGAVVDSQFNTTDVLLMVKTDMIKDRYAQHYIKTAKE